MVASSTTDVSRVGLKSREGKPSAETGSSSTMIPRSPFSRRGTKSSRESPTRSRQQSPKGSRSLASARPVANRQAPICASRKELTNAGFSSAQADGVLIARTQSSSARVSVRGPGDITYVQKLKELKEAGFSPLQLTDAGFPAGVLKGAGFTLEELQEAGGNLQFLRQAGFQVPELMEKGFTVANLKSAGLSILQLRKEGHVPLSELREAGFRVAEFRENGFGPGELRDAGFALKDIGQAGFTAVQLAKKAGFKPFDLREAGYATNDVLAALPNLTEADMLEAGFPLKQVLAAFRSKPPHLANAEVGASNGANRQRGSHDKMAFREKVKAGLNGLLKSPPEPVVVGPSNQEYRGRALWGLKPYHEPRRTAIFFVEWRGFDPIILSVILANCVTMAWESPLDPDGTWKANFIDKCEWIFLGVYTLEMLLKILSYGFVMFRGAYLRDPWCQLDFLVVSLAWLPILTPLSVGNFAVIRSIRALRPLRALKRVPGMPRLVQSILDVLPKMGSVTMLCGFMFMVFGIVGVQIFKGSLHYRCALSGAEAVLMPADSLPGHGNTVPVTPRLTEEAEFDTEVSCNPSKGIGQCEAAESCEYFGENPSDGLVSFDTIGSAFVILLQAVTFDDWATSMFALMSALSPYVVLFYLLIIMAGGFFIVNLFLAVIFEAFISASRVERASEEMENRTQDAAFTEATGAAEHPLTLAPPATASAEDATSALLSETLVLSDTEASKLLLTAAQSPSRADILLEHRKQRRRNGGIFTGIANSAWLANASLALVVLNLILMCLPYEGMSRQYEGGLEQIEAIITAIFVVEMAIKLLGLGCEGYWTDGWNALDGTIVLMSVLEVVVTDILKKEGTVPKLSFLRILRMLRVARVLRLMRSWKGLYKILMTFGKAIPQMSNLFVLTFLTMVIFALLGMQMFGGIYKDIEELPYRHFDYFGPAMSTVFIIMTGAWIDAAGPAAAVLGVHAVNYFIVAVLVGRYLVFNLFIGILLNAFSEEDEDDALGEAPAAAPAVAIAAAQNEATGHQEPPDLLVEKPQPEDYALFLFGPRNPIRKLCLATVSHPAFDQFVIIMILVSSVCVGLDSPRLDPNSPLLHMLRVLDYIWVILFLSEMSLKAIAHCFAVGKHAYIKSIWNQIDFAIVLVSIIVLASDSVEQLQPLRSLRILRVLRPLRLVSKNPGMKLILTSLVKALPAVSNVFFVVIALQTVFAILGMQLFSGRLASCSDPSHQTQETCVAAARRELEGSNSEISSGATQAIVWANPLIGSFDNFGEAMRLLFVMSSGDEWETPMYTMMAATEPGFAPVRNDYSAAAFFSIAWMFVGSFFALNLFVGVIVDSFAHIKAETDSSATMTPEQQQWVKTMQAMSKQQPAKGPRPPSGRFRRWLFQTVSSPIFDGVITAIITLNIFVMACDYWGIDQHPIRQQAFDIAMRLFTDIYYCEFVLKMVALGPAGYFASGWNRFDFFLVCTAGTDDFLEIEIETVVPVSPFLLRVMRVFRILRILRLLKGAKQLRDLIVTTILSFPSLMNVGALLTLLVFMYAVVGVNLFCFLEQQENIDSQRNFESLGSAALLLFQALTGDAWSGLMADAMLRADSGLCSADARNCGSPIAIPYFVSFMIMGSFVFLNLVVAVILENFSSLGSLNPDLVSAADVEAFKEAWVDFDPDADNYIPAQDLPLLVLSLPPPMGLKGVSGERAAVKRCLQLNVTQHNGTVAFQEVLQALCQHSFFSSSERDPESFKKLDTPTPPSPPPLPAGMSIKPLSTQDSEGADRFALSQPSVRRVFALKVIGRHSSNFAVAKRRNAEMAAYEAVMNPGSARQANTSQLPASQKLTKRQRAAAALRASPGSVRGCLSSTVRGCAKQSAGTSSHLQA